MVYDFVCFYYLVCVLFLNALFLMARVYFRPYMCQGIDCTLGFESVLVVVFVFHVYFVGAQNV